MKKEISNFILDAKTCTFEYFRYGLRVDLEVCDESKKKLISSRNLKLSNINNFLKIKQSIILQKKSDLIHLIKNSKEYMYIHDLIKGYSAIKKDLIELTKHKGKDRIFILTKHGADFSDLLLFSYNKKNQPYITTSAKNIISWHKI